MAVGGTGVIETINPSQLTLKSLRMHDLEIQAEYIGREEALLDAKDICSSPAELGERNLNLV